MPAIGMGMIWAGYTGILWGYCIVTRKNVTLMQLVNPRTALDWKTAVQQKIPAGHVFPTTAAPAAATATASSSKGGSQGQPPSNPQLA